MAEDKLDNIEHFLYRAPQDIYDNRECIDVEAFGDDDDKAKWAGCPKGYFIFGFHDPTKPWLLDIDNFACCRDKRWEKQHWGCTQANWSGLLEKANAKVTCPDAGYGITHLYKTDGQELHKLWGAKCCRMPCSTEAYKHRKD